MRTRGPVAARARRLRSLRRDPGAAGQEAPLTLADPPLETNGGAPAPAPAPERSRRRRVWSMRAHLWTIVATALVALCVAGVVLDRQNFRRDRHRAGLDAGFEARLAASELGEALPDLRDLVFRSATSLGSVTAGRLSPLSPDNCNLTFGAFRIFRKGNLHIVLPDGSVECLPPNARRGAPYAGAPWLGTVMKQVPNTATAVSTGPARDPIAQRWSLFVAAPVFAPTASAPSGVLLLELDLADLAPALVDRFGGPQPVEYLLTDADHKLVASRSVDPGQWDGKDISATPLAQAGDPHGARLTGVDGQPRIYGSAVVDDTRGKKDVNGLKWHVYAGIPVGAAEAQARASRDDLETAGAIVLPLLMLVTLSGILAVKRR